MLIRWADGDISNLIFWDISDQIKIEILKRADLDLSNIYMRYASI